MPKCRDCKNCIGFQQGYYICETYEGIEFVPAYDAENQEIKCDIYEYDDSNDDLTS